MKSEPRGVKFELPAVKIGLYVALLIATCFFGVRFRQKYNAFMVEHANHSNADLTDPDTSTNGTAALPPEFTGLLIFGGVFFTSALWLGLLVGHDVSHFLAGRAMKSLASDEGEGLKPPEYDAAEDVWASGNFLEAIRLLREFYAKHPSAIYAALRIAEIYEKDLQNNLAAALEYEEILKQKLEPERWGWKAIHLCNLYYRLEQPEKATVLLRRIVAEYGRTGAAAKARRRLEQEGIDLESEIPQEETPSKLPPGFGPLKSKKERAHVP